MRPFHQTQAACRTLATIHVNDLLSPRGLGVSGMVCVPRRTR